ncbi:MAG: GntR family transcriptional regulator [Betaproteobacteria bacterium]|nr:GntR family transcriptional regulator [Betaproteobacteria bacterium]
MTKQSSTKRDGSKTDEVYCALRERIRDLQMKPGSLISKDEIAEEFGVSRAPVHEALSRLEQEGLVEIAPQRGSFVAPIRVQDVRESLFTRMALETEAMRHAAQTRDPAMIAALEANLAEQEQSLAGDISRFYVLDEALHMIIFSATGFARTLRFLETARPLLDRIRPIVLPDTGRAERTLAEHHRIVEAIKLGDPEFAAAAMRAHLKAVEGSIESWAVFAARSEGLLGPQLVRIKRTGAG